jgi:dephospho-CoA kinase
VDADPEIRYQRIALRNSETDNVTFDTFIANENREFETTDPNHQNLKKCIEMADFIFINDGNREDLYAQVETILLKIVNRKS